MRHSNWARRSLLRIGASLAAVTARLAPAQREAAHRVAKSSAGGDLVEPVAARRRAPTTPGSFTLLQKNKMFTPHLLVVPVGSSVAFPNADPFFHNVFSLFDGRRFDLGLYEAGSTRSVVFSREGVSYIFCDIHSEMSAVVIALATPYYGFADSQRCVSHEGRSRLATMTCTCGSKGRSRVPSIGSRAESMLQEMSRISARYAPIARNRSQHLNKFGQTVRTRYSPHY
jgi:plastocyanin